MNVRKEKSALRKYYFGDNGLRNARLNFSFAGLYQNQIVAVGTLGCSKNVQDRILLANGFIEMIKRINPKMIIIYGPICKELKIVLEKYNVSYIQFDSDTQSFFKGVDNWPEK